MSIGPLFGSAITQKHTQDKKLILSLILSGVKALDLPVSVITVEVVDMDRASYAR